MIHRIIIVRTLPAYFLFLMQNNVNKERIKKDIEVYPEGNNFLELMNNSRNFRSVFYSRVEKSKLKTLAKFFCPPNRSIDVNINSYEYGGGCRLMHSSGMTIYAKSMGEYCTVHQGVTIGVGKITDLGKIPIIGNNVTIGANAIVIGGICIGDNSIIGAGSVVVTNVPSNSTVVGNPGKIVRKDKK